jgi:Tol biopolymer transport system component
MPDVKFTIDGKQLTAPAGTLRIEACKTAVCLYAFTLYAGLALAAPATPIQNALGFNVKPAEFGLFHPYESDSFTTINAAFSPDGKTVYFSKSQPGWTGLTIFQSHREGSSWSNPEVAAFSGIYKDTDPAVTPDGKAVIFASMRDAQGHASKNYSLFRASLEPTNASTVTPLNPAINDGSSVLYPSIAKDGTLYFMRSAGKTARIHKAELKNGDYLSSQEIKLPGDTDTVFDSDPTIAPDQSFIVFASNRPDSLGSNDLYLAFRHGQDWCTPIHLDAPINSPAPELATGLSPDGRTLYFATARSIVQQPREHRATAASFRSDSTNYQNGTMRTYQVDLGPWLDQHRSESETCKTSS